MVFKGYLIVMVTHFERHSRVCIVCDKYRDRVLQGAGGKLDCEGGFSIGSFSLGCKPGRSGSEPPAKNDTVPPATKGPFLVLWMNPLYPSPDPSFLAVDLFE